MRTDLFINPLKAKAGWKPNYGNRIHPITHKPQFHNGVDIGCPIGTPILCPANGKVIKADKESESHDAGGWELKIQHDNGFITGYAHLSKIHVKVGDFVTQGQNIALSGNSGIGTGAHLHFTLRKGTNPNGQTINPMDYFDFKT